MTTGQSPFRMESAGSLTPSLEGAHTSLRHPGRSQPPQKRPSPIEEKGEKGRE